MTIKDLKEIIQNLPDDMLVGRSGYMGEYLKCYDAYVSTVTLLPFKSADNNIKILDLNMETMGEEPE